MKANQPHAKQGAQLWRVTWAHFWHHRWHHLLVAMTLGALTLIAENAGTLAWLDAVMLRLIAPQVHTHPTPPAPGQAHITTLVIGPGLYHDARGFQGRSPLDPVHLRPILAAIEAAQPKAILMDLQLEPGLSNCPPTQAECDPHYDAAVTLGHAPYVLPLPVLRDEAGNQASMAWLRELCGKGMRFASPDVRSHLGQVVRVDRTPGTLAAETLALLSPAPAHGAGEHPQAGAHDHQAHSHSQADAPPTCELAQAPAPQGARDLAMLRAMTRQPGTASAAQTEPVHPAVLSQVLASTYVLRRCGNDGGSKGSSSASDICTTDSHGNIQPLAATLQHQREASGQAPWAIALGGDFDERDRFKIMGLSQPGPVIQSVALATRGRVSEHHALALAADIVLGMLAVLPLGLAVELSRRWGASARTLARHAAFPKLLGAAVCLVLTGALPWLVAGAIVAALVLSSASILDHGLWLNPGPMILGMAVHTLLESQAQEHGPEQPHQKGEHAASTEHPGEELSLWRQHPRLLVSLLLIAYAATSLLSSKHH